MIKLLSPLACLALFCGCGSSAQNQTPPTTIPQPAPAVPQTIPQPVPEVLQTTPTTPPSVPTVPSFKKSLSKIKSNLESIVNNQVARTNQEQAVLQERMKQKLLDENQRAEKQRAALVVQGENKKRQDEMRTALAKKKTEQDDTAQQERMEYAKAYFSKKTYDPSKIFILAKSLRDSGAKVEFRGKAALAIKEFKKLRDTRDWLKMANYNVTKYGAYDSYGNGFIPLKTIPDKFPGFKEIKQADRSLIHSDFQNLSVFILTKREDFDLNFDTHRMDRTKVRSPFLCYITFPLFCDEAYTGDSSWPDGTEVYDDAHVVTSLHVGYFMKQHPDKTGYFTKWMEPEKLCIISPANWLDDGNSDIGKRLVELQEQSRKSIKDLNVKYALGDITQEQRVDGVIKDVVYVFHEIKTFIEGK